MTNNKKETKKGMNRKIIIKNRKIYIQKGKNVREVKIEKRTGTNMVGEKERGNCIPTETWMTKRIFIDR